MLVMRSAGLDCYDTNLGGGSRQTDKRVRAPTLRELCSPFRLAPLQQHRKQRHTIDAYPTDSCQQVPITAPTCAALRLAVLLFGMHERLPREERGSSRSRAASDGNAYCCRLACQYRRRKRVVSFQFGCGPRTREQRSLNNRYQAHANCSECIVVAFVVHLDLNCSFARKALAHPVAVVVHLRPALWIAAAGQSRGEVRLIVGARERRRKKKTRCASF